MTIADRLDDADERPGDPIAVICDVARVLEACGEQLAAGDRILAGSVVHVPVGPGARATARIRGLGDATVYISG
jgi:2-keto-4-pentenoate hydratase